MDFAKSAETQFNLKLPNYDAIHDWSINSTEDFWSHAYNYLGAVSYTHLTLPTIYSV